MEKAPGDEPGAFLLVVCPQGACFAGVEGDQFPPLFC